MQNSPFFSISVPKAKDDLAKLHEQVVQGTGRIELTSDDVKGTSVIISKDELQSLEKALEILSDAEGYQHIHAFLNQLGQSSENSGGSNLHSAA